MSNNNRFSGAKHERQPKLDGFQHEASVKRWPIRHSGETNGHRSVLSMFPDLLRQQQTPQVKSYDNPFVNKFQTVANNVVDIASRQPEVVPAPAVEQSTPQTTEVSSDLDAIRSSVARLYDQEAA